MRLATEGWIRSLCLPGGEPFRNAEPREREEGSPDVHRTWSLLKSKLTEREDNGSCLEASEMDEACLAVRAKKADYLTPAHVFAARFRASVLGQTAECLAHPQLA